MTAKDTNQIITFGCRLNIYESTVIEELISKSNLKNTVIINTCAVTSEAERQARQVIRKLRRKNPNLKIIVTGCSAQTSPEKYAKMSEVDAIVGNVEKMKQQTYLELSPDTAICPPALPKLSPAPFLEKKEQDIAGLEKNQIAKLNVSDIMQSTTAQNNQLSDFGNYHKAFIEIQNGCNHRCTFCIIPFARGNCRSTPIDKIISQVKLLVAKGYKEMILTGVDISSYGEDLPGKPSLGQLVKRLLQSTLDLPRLRLSSIDCADVNSDLLEVFRTEKRLMAHIHLSVQSGDDLILKRMARRHNCADIFNLCKSLRSARADVTIGADIITGFPTESDEMFKNTQNMLRKCNIIYLHAFAYSKRDGTPASRIPKEVEVEVRKKRAAILRDDVEKMRLSYFNSLKGKVVSVLVERDNCGYSEHFAPVKISEPTEAGQIINALITGFTDGKLIANKITE